MVKSNRYKFIQWDITDKCNLDCLHCRSKTFYGNGEVKKNLTTDEALKTIDSLHANGVRRIHILGGEPFTRTDLTELAAYAFEKGIIVSINTNGTLIDEETAVKILDASVYLLTFSLDGPDPETNDYIRGKGTFDKVTSSIRRLDKLRREKKKYLRMIVTPVVMRSNIDRLHRMLDLATELNLNNIIFTNLRKIGGATEIYDDLNVGHSDKIAFVERVVEHAAEVKKKHGRCVHIQPGIVGSPILLALNKKYGTSFAIHGGGGCSAGYSKGFLQPDGALFPCQDLARAALDSGKREEARRKGTDSWMERDEVEELRGSLFRKETYSSYKPCNRCPLLMTFCIPCPIPALRGDGIVKSDCIAEFSYAKKNGIDVARELEAHMQDYFRERVIHDPEFRERFITGDQSLYDDFRLTSNQRGQIDTLRDKVLSDISRVLESSLTKGENN